MDGGDSSSPHFIFLFLPFRASPFSTCGLEVLGRSPFMRQIVNHGTGYALINGRIVMHTQADGEKRGRSTGRKARFDERGGIVGVNWTG